jgi:hypothetical protein
VLQVGCYDEATEEKLRLEEKQRGKRREEMARFEERIAGVSSGSGGKLSFFLGRGEILGTRSEVTSMKNCYKKELSQMSSGHCYYRVRLNAKRSFKNSSSDQYYYRVRLNEKRSFQHLSSDLLTSVTIGLS